MTEERWKKSLDAILITATAHGWNGVDNSKILEVFIENELIELAELRAEQERNQKRFEWLEWAMKSELTDFDSLRSLIYLDDAVNSNQGIVDAIDKLRAERRDK